MQKWLLCCDLGRSVCLSVCPSVRPSSAKSKTLPYNCSWSLFQPNPQLPPSHKLKVYSCIAFSIGRSDCAFLYFQCNTNFLSSYHPKLRHVPFPPYHTWNRAFILTSFFARFFFFFFWARAMLRLHSWHMATTFWRQLFTTSTDFVVRCRPAKPLPVFTLQLTPLPVLMWWNVFKKNCLKSHLYRSLCF